MLNKHQKKISEEDQAESLIRTSVTNVINRQEVRTYKKLGSEKSVETESIHTILRGEKSIRGIKEGMGWRFYATDHPTLELQESARVSRTVPDSRRH